MQSRHTNISLNLKVVYILLHMLDSNCQLSLISSCGWSDRVGAGFKWKWTYNLSMTCVLKRMKAMCSLRCVYDFFLHTHCSLSERVAMTPEALWQVETVPGLSWQCLSLSNCLQRGAQTLCWSATVCMRHFCIAGGVILHVMSNWNTFKKT